MPRRRALRVAEEGAIELRLPEHKDPLVWAEVEGCPQCRVVWRCYDDLVAFAGHYYALDDVGPCAFVGLWWLPERLPHHPHSLEEATRAGEQAYEGVAGDISADRTCR